MIDGLNQMSVAGALTHVIGTRFSLDRIVAAHEAVEQGKLIGNVIIDNSSLRM